MRKRARDPSPSTLRLPLAVAPLYGTTLVDVLGYTLMLPLLPVVAQEYGASPLAAGALLSVPALCSTIAAPLWGKASDSIGRKRILLASQCFSLVGYLVLALAPSLTWMFVARIISGIGAGNVGTAQSYIADVTSVAQRDRAYAFYGAVFGIGFVGGPVISGLLARHGVAVPFFVAAGLEVVNLIFTGLFLPQRPPSQTRRFSLRRTLEVAGRTRIRKLFAREFLFVFGTVFFLTGFALYIQRALQMPVITASWLLAAAGGAGGLCLVLLVTPLARRVGDLWASQIGLFVLAVAYLAFFWVTDLPMLVGAVVLWAAAAAMVQPTLWALLSRRTPQQERGGIMGLGDSLMSIAMILAPLAGSAVVGAQARAIGFIPGLAALIALVIGGRFSVKAVTEQKQHI